MSIASLINANNELLSCFKSYDEMLEQHAMNEATVNSTTLHNRTSRQVSGYMFCVQLVFLFIFFIRRTAKNNNNKDKAQVTT